MSMIDQADELMTLREQFRVMKLAYETSAKIAKARETIMAEQVAAIALLHGAVLDAELMFEALAERLEGWAIESQSGGWSTHQVTPNRIAAAQCRAIASQLRTAKIKAERK